MSQKLTSPKNVQSFRSSKDQNISDSERNRGLNNKLNEIGGTAIITSNEKAESGTRDQEIKLSSQSRGLQINKHENILADLNKATDSNSEDDQAQPNHHHPENHEEFMEKYGDLEKCDDSMHSPTKSILKRASLKELKEADMSPDRKKKGVAFSLAGNGEQNLAEAAYTHEEHKGDDIFLMMRQRSKSNEGERSYGSFSGGKYSDTPRNIIVRNVSVGRVQDGVAILLSEDFSVMEMPLSMLPPDVRKGNIFKFTVERNVMEEESRKESIVRVQRELLADKTLFDEYNKKLEHFKNKKIDALQANNKKNLNLQKVIDDVHINLQESSFLDRSVCLDDDRVIVRPKNIVEAKLEKNEAASTKSLGLRK